MAYPDRDAPWNRTYCYSRLNIKRFMSVERGYSIHQKVNLNYNMGKYVGSKIEYMYKHQRECVLFDNPFSLIHPEIRGMLHLLDRNRHSIEKDVCEACKQQTERSWDLFKTNLCRDCKLFKRRYQNRTGDDTVEGWLSWSLSRESAYKKHIRKIGAKK
jgi:hypothetical protein